MNPSVRDIQDRLISAMSAEQKLLVSEGLRRAAWTLKAAWLRDQNPDLPESEIQERTRKVFRDAGA